MIDKSDAFKIKIQLTKHNDDIEVRANTPTGQARCETSAPSETLIKNIFCENLNKLPKKVFDNIGNELYKRIMIGDVGKLVFDSISNGIEYNNPVHFELRFDSDQIELARYPWELIKDDSGRFLVKDGIIDVTRSITYPQPLPVLRDKLNDSFLLRIVSQPTILPPISLIDLNVKKIETINHATFSQFQKKLLIDRINTWGLQFDGHGALLQRCNKCNNLNKITNKSCLVCNEDLSNSKRIGVLAFEKGENERDIDFVTTEDFGSVLYNSGIQIALLMACETAKIGSDLLFNGLAPGLILSGVPAVIGMQFPVLDSFANLFANTFYTVLLKNGSLLEAMRVSRKMGALDTWFVPSLYLRYKPEEDSNIKPIYETRSIDTAVPSQVIAGKLFLVRLWIRRPTTQPISEENLRRELSIDKSIEVSIGSQEEDVKFEPVIGRKFRRGIIEINLQSPNCDIMPDIKNVFIDEHRDAPPVFFTVKVKELGCIPLIFVLSQDEAVIATIIHNIDAVDFYEKSKILTYSGSISLQQEDMPKGLMIIKDKKMREFDLDLINENMKVIEYVMRIFQICPMSKEPTVLEQMIHFSKCGRCYSYIFIDPNEINLHPFIKQFLHFCYNNKILHDDEIQRISNIDSIQYLYSTQYFKKFIRLIGDYLLNSFITFLNTEDVDELAESYLLFKANSYTKHSLR